MKSLCSIVARGGSKGVKNKNLRELLGRPLIAHSIVQAKESELFEYISVSSDSDDILKTAKQWGADFLIKRPPELATDSSPKIPAIRHCFSETERLAGCQFALLVDLDVTSPLRNVEDIRGAHDLLVQRDVSNVITGVTAKRSPYFNLVEENEQGFVEICKKPTEQIARRQDVPRCFDMNASIYVWKREVILNSDILFHSDTLLFEMPEERSVDIDSELDFDIVEFLASRNKLLTS